MDVAATTAGALRVDLVLDAELLGAAPVVVYPHLAKGFDDAGGREAEAYT